MNEKTQDAINREIHTALYGINGEPGLIEKTNEVWEILSAFRLFGKAIMWLALFVGAVATALTTVWPLIKSLFNKLTK